MAGRPKSIDDSKIFDVSKPGKSKPMGTSRPVIMNRGTMVKDQSVIETPEEKEMLAPPSVARRVISPVSAESEPSETAAKETNVPVTSESPEQPAREAVEKTELSADEPDKQAAQEAPGAPETDEPEAVTEETAAETPATEASKDAVAETQPDAPAESPEQPEAEAETSSTDVPAGSDSANVEALAEASEKKTHTKEDEEQAKRDAELQSLIDSKKYVVPIAHDSGKSGGHKILWVFIIVLLLAAGVYAAIDAGTIDAPVDLPYHFFPQ